MNADSNIQSNPSKPISSWLSQKKLYFKIFFILFLILLLMIPNAFISSLIHERSSLRFQTQNEISQTWGGEQVVSGPVLVIPYETSITSKDGDVNTYPHNFYVAPDDVIVDTEVNTEERKKSIYSTTLFTSANELKSKISIPGREAFSATTSRVKWNDAYLFIPFQQTSSIIESVKATIEGKSYNMSLFDDPNLNRGIMTRVPIVEGGALDVSALIKVRGSRMINFQPMGTNNKFTMTCDWPSPGFEGNMLPNERTITKDGFEAQWITNEYNSSVPKTWIDHDPRQKRNSVFGARLVQTVDHYQKNIRSVKYAMLIICLSFLVFFFYEVMKGYKVHPVQYILIGLALSLFYLLLLSLSEHLGFNMAYLIAGTSTVALVTWYSMSIIKAGKGVLALGGILAGLYVYIFVLLQMEDYALLAGAVGLFVILTVVMGLSRKMNWYKA